MLGFPLTFYRLSGVRDFWPSQLQFYPGIYVALITFFTSPLSICTALRSFSSMKRLQIPLRRTMTEERLSSPGLQFCIWAQGRDWYWWHYNRVCLSEGYTSHPSLVTSLMALPFFTDNTRDCLRADVFLLPLSLRVPQCGRKIASETFWNTALYPKKCKSCKAVYRHPMTINNYILL